MNIAAVTAAAFSSRRCAATFLHSHQTLVSSTTTTKSLPSLSTIRSFSSFGCGLAHPTKPLCLKMAQQQQQPNHSNNRRQVEKVAPPAAVSGEEILASFSKPQKGQNVALAMESLANADAVCFDVDSTVIAEEGIDVLADFLGQGEAVAALTKQAMEGSQKFQDALKARLDLMKPSRNQIEQCLEQMPLKLTPGIEDLIEAFNDRGIHVYFVSGGFRIMIEPVAFEVCVAKDHIYANTILFEDDEEGTYKGFDPNEPTSADMGKPKALQMIKQKNGYKTMVMVGDGATDAQAKPPADAFIGFGGVVVRPAVEKAADWFVTDFRDMTKIVEKFSQEKIIPGAVR